MTTIEAHIQHDRDILNDPQTSPQARRHIETELHDLEVYEHNHHEEIVAGDHHDPNCIELFCEMNPSEPECKVFDD